MLDPFLRCTSCVLRKLCLKIPRKIAPICFDLPMNVAQLQVSLSLCHRNTPYGISLLNFGSAALRLLKSEESKHFVILKIHYYVSCGSMQLAIVRPWDGHLFEITELHAGMCRMHTKRWLGRNQRSRSSAISRCTPGICFLWGPMVLHKRPMKDGSTVKGV